MDPQGQALAVERATALLIDIAGGEAGPLLIAEEPDSIPRNRAVTLRPERLNSVIGCEIQPESAESILPNSINSAG